MLYIIDRWKDLKRIVSLWICVMLLGSTALATNSNNEHEQTNNSVDLSVNPLDITYADYPMENHSIKLTASIQGDKSNRSDWGKYGVVLDVGGTGESNSVTAPNLLKISENNYVMWYSASGADGHSRIYRASSTDGMNWTKEGLAVDIGGTYEDNHVDHPCVIIDSNETYHMWYSGHRYSAPPQSPHWFICKATSIDGYTWVKQGLDLSSGGVSGALMPFVLYDNEEWKMWYADFYKATPTAPDEFNIMYAYKTNLTDPWVKYGTVLDNTGEYDYPQAFSPHVLKVSDGYEMYYSGYRSLDSTTRVLHATSPNGLGWTRTGIVFEPTMSDEGTNVMYSYVINENNVSRMWYAGGPGSGNHVRIFYAQNNNTIEYGHNATCDLTIYLNLISPNNIINYFTNVNVSYDNRTSLSTYCNLPEGTYSIIAEIKNVTPSDYNISNNIASKTIIVYPYHSDWPMHGHNIQHTCVNSFTEAPSTCYLKWSFDLHNESIDGPFTWFTGSPIAVYGNVYILGSGDNKTLFCFNQETGNMVWNYTFDESPKSTTPAIYNGRIYSDVYGKLYCHDAFNGSLIWCQDYGYSVWASPLIEDDRLYFANDTSLMCISLINNSIIWNIPASGRFLTPTIMGDNLFYITATDYIYSVNKMTGAQNWMRYLDFCDGQIMCSNGKLYVGVWYRYYCLDENTGNTIWYINIPYAPAIFPGINMDRVYLPCFGGFSGSPGVTYCVESDTGNIIWQTPRGSRGAPAIVDGKVYIGDSSGTAITCMNESDGQILWDYGYNPMNYSVGSMFSSPCVVNGRVFDGSVDGTLRCYEIEPSFNLSTATATGPQGAGHDPIITLTYTWNGTPNAVDLFYSLNHGETWNYIGTDPTVDGFYNWTPPDAYPCPKPRKYYWIANAQGGADDVGIPADGTPPEAGPYNWKTWDVTLGASSKGPGAIGWFFVSVPLNVSGNLTTVFDDSIWGDGGTIWDYAMWYDSTDSVKPWKTYSKYRPESLNDQFDYSNLMGVWIHITSNAKDGFLTAGEGDNSTSTTIPLYAGWNMVGYPSLSAETVANALWGTGADRVEVFDSSDPYRTKEVGSTYIMKPGEAYWVHVPADATWVVNW
jgi:outer membrane protein assembly factor BamB